MSPPDRAGREAILRVHTRSVPLAPDVDLGAIAASTPGMVGADLANVANEAALLAAKRGHEKVARQDVSDALERIVLGAERKVMISDEDRRRTAYHEAGHAIMGMLTPGADPVRKVSIIPRGQALGVTFSAPDADRFNFDERHLLAQIKVALGGRVAEEVVFGDLTTGAESDIQQLTRIARHMVGRWGMSPAIGPIAVLPVDGIGPLLPGVSETSEQTQRLIDEEVRRIVETAHEEALETLAAHRHNLDALVAGLLEHETLDEAEAYSSAGLPRNPQAEAEETVPVVPADPTGPASGAPLADQSTRRPAKPASGACQKPIPAPRRPASRGRPPRRLLAPGSRPARARSRGTTMSTASSSPAARLSSTSGRATDRPG